MNKVGLILTALVLLQACTRSPDIEIRGDPVPVVCDTSARPDALNLADTPPTLVPNADGVFGFWFSPERYAGLAENLQAMRRWMKQSSAIRANLVDCIEAHNAPDPPP